MPIYFFNSDGRLHADDRLCAVNGKALDSAIVSHREAVSLLQAATGWIELVVARPEYFQHNQKQPPVNDESEIHTHADIDPYMVCHNRFIFIPFFISC